MMSRLRLASLLLASLVLAACGGSDVPETPDAPTGSPDAPIVVGPDAPVGTPDAAPGTPDAPIVVGPDAAVGDCTSAPVLTPGTPVTGTTAGATNTTQGSCGGAAAGEAVWQFVVTDTTGVTISTDYPTTDFNAAVYVRTTCDNPSTQVGCGGSGPLGDTFTVTLDPGTYYVFVDGIAGATGNYELSVDVNPVLGPGDPCDPMMNLCSGGLACIDSGMGPVCTDPSTVCTMLATPVTPGTPIMTSTIGGTDASVPPCSTDGGANDVTFVVDVPPGGPRDLVVSAPQTNFMVDMFDVILWISTTCGDGSTSLDCQDSPGAAAVETSTITDVAAGTYYITVDGYNGTAGDFELDVTLRDIVGAGGVCDPAGVTSRCTAGLTCADDGAGGFTCQDPTVAVCDAGTAITGSTTVTGTLVAGDPSLLTATCGAVLTTPEDVYYIDLAVPSIITATNTTTLTGSRLYVRGPSTCADAATVVCDTTTGGLSVTTPPLGAGRWYIIIDGTGDYSLDITVNPTLPTGSVCDETSTTDRCGAGDWCIAGTCQTVTFVTDTPPNAAFCDAQGPYSSDFVVNPASMTGGTDVDTFQVDLAAAATLQIDTSNGFGGCVPDTVVDVYDAMGMTCDMLDMGMPMAAFTDDDTGPGACSSLNTGVLAAGTYYVSVSWGGGATGAYVLVVDVQ